MYSSRILCVLRDTATGSGVVELLYETGDYDITIVNTFQDAVDHILTGNYMLMITDVCLDQMSGIDLLTIINKLHPEISVIVIDEAMNSQHALAAFRMGALDYLHHPLNLDFLSLRVGQEVARTQMRAQIQPGTIQTAATNQHNRDTRLDPAKRAAMFILRSQAFQQISTILNQLTQDLHSSFVGLMDADHNVISAVGKLVNADLITLRRVLSEDYGTCRLSEVLNQDQSFTHTYFEGEHSSVFITDFGEQYPVSLVIVTPATVKPGIVWVSSKRVAASIDTLINTSANHHIR